MQVLLTSLRKKGLVEVDGHYYVVEVELRLRLFLELMQDPHYVDLVFNTDVSDYSQPMRVTPELLLRNYLLEGLFPGRRLPLFWEWEDRSELADIPDLFFVMHYIIRQPGYDALLARDGAFLARVFQGAFSYGMVTMDGLPFLRRFCERMERYNAEAVLHGLLYFDWVQGRFDAAPKRLKELKSGTHLLYFSHMAVFSGATSDALDLFERARETGEAGEKVRKRFFSMTHEYLYWFSFLLLPDRMNVKEVNAFLKKTMGRDDRESSLLLPLLHRIKSDLPSAKKAEEFSRRYVMDDFEDRAFASLAMFWNRYLVRDAEEGMDVERAVAFCMDLQENEAWLFLNEMLYLLREAGLRTPLGVALPEGLDLPQPLISRVRRAEKWEHTLDGLLALGGPVKAESLGDDSVRVCYLMDPEETLIQPLLQTCRASGKWTKGRNIALSRMKEGGVDGMTEQDHRVAKAIRVSSGYYGAREYFFNGEVALPAVCGHPYLFLMDNPEVPLELVKGQPALITQQTGNVVELKSDFKLLKERGNVFVRKETQTRYRVYALTPVQRKALELLGDGIKVPVEGKARLLKAVEQLSGVLEVQSDLVESSGAMPTVAGDARIRVQILPLGEGLKAELFVKPLNTVPPYAQPGKGGKVIYGVLGGERCQVLRDLAAEAANRDRVLNEVALTVEEDWSGEALLFSDPYDCLHLLETVARLKEVAVLEWPEGERLSARKSASLSNLRLGVKRKGDWFELQGELQVDEDTVVSIKDLLSLSRKARGRFVELKKDQFLALTADLKKQLEELDAFVSLDKGRVQVHRFAAHALDEMKEQVASFKADKSWRDFRKQVALAREEDLPVPAALKAELRPYQVEGFRWMARLHAWGAGACLADDMGLGKTLQAMALLLHLAEKGPSLVVCPASVVPNWVSELQRFAPALNPVLLKPGNREETLGALGTFDVLVVTYGLLHTEQKLLAGKAWAVAVLDEAHAIKNNQTKASKAAMRLTADFKLALTGTPVQNHLGELWNLFNFCNPGLLGTLQHFNDRYIKSESEHQRAHLKKLIAPFILRRTKNKVLDELPAKTEITMSVELSGEEMAFYEALRRQAVETIASGEGNNGQQHLQALAEITRLRLACCHASLVQEGLDLPSSKLDAVMDIVDELFVNQHQALIFSQFVGHLALVRRVLDERGISYQYLDGSTPVPEREKAVRDFQAGKSPLFLISLKAGGLGLNLTAADYVLHLDPWWNPAIEDQASDRAHRMGQRRPVTIYRMVAKNTIEEKIVQLHATKRDMADAMLEGTDQSARLSTADLLALLREV